MLFFPSIFPGNAVQYPVTRRRAQRAIQSITAGGVVYRGIDAGLSSVRWGLLFQDISLAKRQEVDAFFDACEGRLRSFVFLDPFQNLVRQSESFEDPVWERSSSVAVTTNQLDPFGANAGRRLTNTAAASATLTQKLSAPAWFGYTVSCWMRADSQTSVELICSPASVVAGADVAITSTWKRHLLQVQGASTEEEIQVGLRLPGATELYLFGFQVEPFSHMSDYKRTTALAGVYANCRFEQDEISWVTGGIDHHSARIGIHATILP